MKKIISSAIAMIMMLTYFPLKPVQARDTDTYFNETFNKYITNVSLDDIELDNALKNRVVSDGINNKALLIEGNIPTLRKAFGKQIADDFVVSFDIKAKEGTLSFMSGIYLSDNTELMLVNVINNVIYTSDNRRIGTLQNGRYTNIAYKFDWDFNLCDIYVNRRCVASDIHVGDFSKATGMVMKATNGIGKMYVDNLAAYQSEKLLAAEGLRNVNSESNDYIDIDDYVGSYEYWNMYYMNISENKFQNVNLYPKDNTIECPRFDYKNKYRENWLKLTKTTANDCYLDIVMRDRHFRLGNSDQSYKYFVFEGDFMTEGGVQKANFLMLRDAVTGTGNIDCNAVVINGSNLILSDGTVIANVVRPGEWFNYKLAINLADQTISVYINGEERAKDSPMICSDKSKNIGFLSLARLSLVSGEFTADLKMENCKFTGYEKPYVHGEDPKTSLYYDDAPVAEYMQDKIAVHAYAKILMVNNQKYDIADEMSYDEANDEIYVKAQVLSEKLGWNFSNKEEMIPVKKYSSENGYFAKSNKNGLILISDKEIKMDIEGEYQWFVLKPYTNQTLEHATIPEALDDYVFFERPKASELLQMMKGRTDNLAAHPRIYADEEQFDKYRELYKTDATFKEWADVIIAEADVYADPSTPFIDYEYQDAYRMQSIVHTKYQDRFTALGFAYQMTGDKKYVERAFKEFEMLATFPDINPSHIIDTGCMNEAVALGYDWMYHGYTAEQRAFIEEFVLTHCIKPIASAFYGQFSAYCAANVAWYSMKATNNYNIWVIGGLLEATCAFMECDPEYLSDVAEKCIRGVEYAVKGFAPDGAWVEGPDYWQHTTRYLTVYAGTTLNCFGDDFNVLEYQGISEAPDWIMSITGIKGTNNFGDAVTGQYTFDEYSFFSHYFDKKAIGSLRKYDIVENGAEPGIYDVLFYNPDITTTEFEELPKVVTTRGVESSGIRESFTDKDGMFFSACGGAAWAYHSHYDTGAFVFDINGVRWAHDLGKDNYNTGLTDHHIYRKRSEAHNTVTMNINADADAMLKDSFAPITKSASNDHTAYVVYDMSDVFAETDKYERGFYVGDDYRSLTIRDELSLNTETDVLWTMNTMADVALWGNEAMLYQDGEVLRVKVECDAKNWEFVELPCQSLVKLPTGAVAQATNSEYTKLAIKVTGDKNFNITVKLAPYGEAADKTAVNTSPISSWDLSESVRVISLNNETVEAKIYADGELTQMGKAVVIKNPDVMPEITVKAEPGASYEFLKQAKNADEKTIIKVTDTASGNYSLYSVEYSDADLELWKTHNVYEIANYEVSQQLQDANPAPSMFDGNFATRWTSLNEGEYVTVDLGEEKEVSAVAMGFWQSLKRSYNYIIDVSTDGVNYKTVAAGSSPLEAEGYHIYDFTPEKARYIRITGNGNSVNVNTNILELRILGNK